MVVVGVVEESVLKSEIDYWKAYEYEKRLELSLTEKERNDAVKRIIETFKKRLENGGRVEIS